MKQTLKECTRCGIFQDADQYYRSGNNPLSYCRTCRLKQIKQKRLDNLEQYQEQDRAFYTKNKERLQKKRKDERETSLEHKLKHACRNSKQRALEKGWGFDIDYLFLMELWDKQEGRCALSGREMTLAGTRLSNKISIDRIDSSIGYIKGNVQLLAAIVNYMKMDMKEEDFISLCKEVSNAKNFA